MTETEKKALALVNEACKSDFKDLGITYRNNILDALLLAIEQHEAFRQEVSDAVVAALSVFDQLVLDDRGEAALRGARLVFARFIIPKPDPLVEALQAVTWQHTMEDACASFRAALAASGLEIREKQP